jgi:hypothetical protein
MRRRFSDAEVRYRRAFMSSNGGRDNTPIQVTHAHSDDGLSNASDAAATDSTTPTVHRRRVAVNEDGTPIASPDPQQ